MIKLLKVASMTSAAVLAGGFALASVEHVGEPQSVTDQNTSVVLAVAPPELEPSAPVIDRAPAPPMIPPMPNRAPRLPLLDLADDAAGEIAIERLRDEAARALTVRPAPVRAAPSDDAPMLYGFPAKREIRVVGKDGGYVHIVDVESGADGWIQTAALVSDMMTASVEPANDAKPKSKPKREATRQAAAEIDAPEPVSPIPNKPRSDLSGNDQPRDRVDFVSFVRRGLGG